MSANLQHLENNAIRERICRAVGVEPGDRFRGRTNRGLRKRTVRRVADEISDTDTDDLTLAELYRVVCAAAGTEFVGTAGNQWRLPRPALKAVYRALYGAEASATEAKA